MLPMTNNATMQKLKPVLRWAGGKSHIISELGAFIPNKCTRYIEPMLGSGALFFSLCPLNAFLSDINSDLINYYLILRDNFDVFTNRLFQLKASRRNYYNIRSMNPKDPIERAVRFAYLNRLCWNGLYRVNKDNIFNVPIGSRLPKNPWNRERLKNASVALKSATLRSEDFSIVLDDTRPGDLVFLDPPYPRGANGNNGFDRYSSVKFSLQDHHRLADHIRYMDNRGTYIILTLIDDQKLRNIYPKYFESHTVSGKSLISGHKIGRRIVKENILINFSINK
jgi:DNA adenine methylase